MVLGDFPFGLKHKGYNNNVSSLGNSTAQKFGYNGKELNEELGIDWHDFGARNYDAALGRWMNIDPLAEKYKDLSPFNFVSNNPIYFIDPDGREIEPALNQSGTIQQAAAQWKEYGITSIKQIKSFVNNKNIDGKGGKAIRYVYTKKNGWIDLAHYAGTQHYGQTAMDALEPASGNKFLQDNVFGEGADKSYYSYEDFPIALI